MVFTRKQRQESESETDEGHSISRTKNKKKTIVTPRKQKPLVESNDTSDNDQSDQQVDDNHKKDGNPMARIKELKKLSDKELNDEEEFLRKENVKKILLELRQEKTPKGHSQQVGNSLTLLIPGYIAPMKLESKASDTLSLSEFRQQAERTDKSTKDFVLGQTSVNNNIMVKSGNGFMPTIYSSKFASFKYGTKKLIDLSAGSGWFHMQPATMTDSLKTDLAVIRHRTYLDPKRFYKKSDKSSGKVLQVGTVIEGAAEFYSSRLANKDRRQTLTAEIMADPGTADYAKRKFKKMQQEKSEAGQKSKRRKPNKQTRRVF